MLQQEFRMQFATAGVGCGPDAVVVDRAADGRRHADVGKRKSDITALRHASETRLKASEKAVRTVLNAGPSAWNANQRRPV